MSVLLALITSKSLPYKCDDLKCHRYHDDHHEDDYHHSSDDHDVDNDNNDDEDDHGDDISPDYSIQ